MGRWSDLCAAFAADPVVAAAPVVAPAPAPAPVVAQPVQPQAAPVYQAPPQAPVQQPVAIQAIAPVAAPVPVQQVAPLQQPQAPAPVSQPVAIQAPAPAVPRPVVAPRPVPHVSAHPTKVAPKAQGKTEVKPAAKPAIEYDYFETKVLRIVFEGGKHFIFQGSDQFRIKEGAVIIIQKDGQNLMAVQVHNGGSAVRTFSAKTVKNYFKDAELILGETYTAVARGLKSDPEKDVGRFLFDLTTGYSYVTYAETFSADFAESVLNFGGSASYVLSKVWRLYSKAGFLMLPIKAAPEPFTARFIWVEGGGACKAQGVKKPWELTLLPSFRYLTSFVTTDSFGYQGLMGPQVAGRGSFEFSNGQSVSLDARFALLTASNLSPSFGKKEWGVSGSWSLAPVEGRRWSAGVEYSSLSFAVGVIELSARHISMGISYSW
ncbi:hypothetical protein WDW86_19305 [Bdellovibrionota bacterium FG-2]